MTLRDSFKFQDAAAHSVLAADGSEWTGIGEREVPEV